MVKRSSGELLLTISFDRTSQRSITLQVYSAIRGLITSGALPAGRRLPSSRTLARDLDISRTTAMAVFARLSSEGLIESRTGSGSFVSQEAAGRKPLSPAPADIHRPASARLADMITKASPNFFRRLAHPHQPRAFVTGLPDYDTFPLAVWAQLSARYWRQPRSQILGYPEPNGYRPLREAIAGHLRANRGIDCDIEQIFIVNGAQQAFDLIGRMMLNPGDPVWFENPGAIGARNSLIACGARIVPVPVDEEGLCVAQALQLAPDFRLAFVTPAHQHPAGSEMSMERRSQLLAAANSNDAFIIEDDYDGEFRFRGRPLPTLKSADQGERVFYVGTFSKTMFPALRLGFYIVPKPLVPAFQRISGAFLQGVPSASQAILASFMEEGHFATHLRRMRDVYACRHAAWHEAEEKYLKGLVSTRPSSTGFHVVAHFCDTRLEESAVEAGASTAGLVTSPLGRFCISTVDERALVLGVSAIDERAIGRGAATLAQVLEQCLKA